MFKMLGYLPRYIRIETISFVGKKKLRSFSPTQPSRFTPTLTRIYLFLVFLIYEYTYYNNLIKTELFKTEFYTLTS